MRARALAKGNKKCGKDDGERKKRAAIRFFLSLEEGKKSRVTINRNWSVGREREESCYRAVLFNDTDARAVILRDSRVAKEVEKVEILEFTRLKEVS